MTPVTPAAAITQTGETPNNQTASAAIVANETTKGLKPLFFSMLTTGTTISETTAGRMPRKMRSTVGFSRMSVKNMATSRMTTNDGMTVPKTAVIIPPRPSVLYPTKTAELIEIGPGADCAKVSISVNSSRSIHRRRSTTSFSISGIIT